MKWQSFWFTTLFASFTLITHSQGVGIGHGPVIPHPSAMLDIQSTGRGVLIPRVSTTQRLAIQAPASGLLVFDSTTASFWYYANTWRQINTAPGNEEVFTLPYQGSAPSGSPTFGITNTLNGFAGPAILGRSLAGSGLAAGVSAIWGDHEAGSGVTGTSKTGNGVYGISQTGHGVYGISATNEKAGIYGLNQASGSGILGETNAGGIGVMGKSLSPEGVAGWFRTESNTNTKNALNVQHFGLGKAAEFFAANNNNTAPVARATGGPKSMAGFMAGLSSEGESSAAVFAENYYKGMGVYASSKLGIAGRFENTDAANPYPVLMATQPGMGTALYVASLNETTTAPAADILAAGNGTGLNVVSNKGRAGEFWVTGALSGQEGLLVKNDGNGHGVVIQSNKPTATGKALLVNQSGFGTAAEFNVLNTDAATHALIATHAGEGSAAFFNAAKSSSPAHVVEVVHAGKGRGVNINLENAANTNAGLNVSSAGQRGITVDVQGQFGLYSFAAANSGTGVWGRANGTEGIGVKGTSGIGNLQKGTGVWGESGSNDEQGIGVKGINYSSSETLGAVTGINMSNGVGLYGETRGNDGIGVLGVAGAGGFQSRAAQFKNIQAANTKNVVEILNEGNGTNLYLRNLKAANSAALLRGVYAGTGNFLTLENNLGNIKTTIKSTGDITTDGAITVKENKGIVRNSASAQLRVETLTATFTPAGGSFDLLQPNQSREVTLSFGTAFGSAPVVYVANCITDGNSTFMNVQIISVSTTGCKLLIRNSTGNNMALYTCSWKVVAMGAE